MLRDMLRRERRARLELELELRATTAIVRAGESGAWRADVERAHQRIEDHHISVARVLLSGLAHDLHAPLTALVANLGLLEDGALRASSASADVVYDARVACELLLGVAESLRVYAASPDAPGWLSVRPVVEVAARLAARHFVQRGVALHPFVEGGPKVWGTVHAVGLVTHGLLVSAADAAPRGSRVWLSTTSREDHVVVRVEDEGPSIPAEARAALFESNAHRRGTGLALARAVARGLGGDVRIADSERGNGAAVELWLVRRK
jgi:signal transduction histidine kinase